jgi:hypothetical protein
MSPYRIGLTDALRMIPDFCWLTYSEIIAYVEQINDNIDENHIGATLAKLVSGGEVMMKLADSPFIRGPGMSEQIRMYRTVSWPDYVKTMFQAFIAVDRAQSVGSPDILPFYARSP